MTTSEPQTTATPPLPFSKGLSFPRQSYGSPPMTTAMKMSQVTSVRSHRWYPPSFTRGLKASEWLNEYGGGENFSKLPHQVVTSMPQNGCCFFFFLQIKTMGKTESIYLSNASRSWQKSHCSSILFFNKAKFYNNHCLCSGRFYWSLACVQVRPTQRRITLWGWSY